MASRTGVTGGPSRCPHWAVRVLLLLAVVGCERSATGSGATASAERVSPSPSKTASKTRPTTSATASTAAPRVGPKVVFLGDSLSAGLHLAAEEAFPAVIEAALRDSDAAFTLLNAGVSGDTTAGGLRRADWVLKQAPDIVVIELGGNDGLRGLPLETIDKNLREIVDKVRQAGAQPVLLGMRLPGSYGKAYSEGFNAMYPRIAADLAVPLVPFFMEGVAGVAELNLPDGIHPTAEGHKRLAQTVEPVLRQAILRLQR